MFEKALKLYADVHEVDITGLVDAYVTPSLSSGSAPADPPVLSISVPKLKKSVSFDNVIKVKMITPKAESNDDDEDEDEDEDDGSQTGRAI
jgi:hypothetical protein